MKTNHKPAPAALNRWKFKGWIVGVTALLSFAAGSLVTARLTHLNQVRADSNRVFQLMVYHTVPGKVPALESIFRDVSKLQAKHAINVVGYWVPVLPRTSWTSILRIAGRLLAPMFGRFTPNVPIPTSNNRLGIA